MWREGIAWTDIEVFSDEDGMDKINLSGIALKKARSLGLEDWEIYFDRRGEAQIAFVLAC